MGKGLGFLRRQFCSLEILLCYFASRWPLLIIILEIVNPENMQSLHVRRIALSSLRKEKGLDRTLLFPCANPISFVSL